MELLRLRLRPQHGGARPPFDLAASTPSSAALCPSSSTARTSPKPPRCEAQPPVPSAAPRLPAAALTASFVPQLPGVPQLHDRHVPPEPAGVPHLHRLPPQPGRRRLRHHEVGLGSAPRLRGAARSPLTPLSAGCTPSWSSGASSTTRWTPRAGPPPWAPRPPPISTCWPIRPPVWCLCSPRRRRWVRGGGPAASASRPPSLGAGGGG